MIVQRAIHIAASLFSAILPSSTCNDVHDCRTVSTIVYSCVSTVFLCTWAALHPNVPHDSWEPGWKRILKRIGWMAAALLAPEAVLVKAANQWTGSCRDLKEKLGEITACTCDVRTNGAFQSEIRPAAGQKRMRCWHAWAASDL